MKRKILSWIIIIIGLLLAAYPKASELYVDYKQAKLVEQWQQSLAVIDSGDDIEIENDEIYNLDEDSNLHMEASPQDPREEGETKEDPEEKRKEEEKARERAAKAAKEKEEYINKNMEGILKINKIKFNQPILKGATEKNLKTSVASVENTGKAGEVGNYAIAGHRTRSYGRNFNRLEEVELGDIVEVDSGDNQYKYTVTEKLYVYPEDVWVLNNNKEDKEITLITCHPMVNPTHRLIIKGKIID